MKTEMLSREAIALLRYRLETRDNQVTSTNLEGYRELVRAGVMFAVSGFVSGPEASLRFSDAGWAWVNGPDSPCASQLKTLSPMIPRTSYSINV
jgi:hypothetical protein